MAIFERGPIVRNAEGEAVLRKDGKPKRKPVSYQVVVDDRDHVTGRRNRVVVGTFASKAEAKEAQAEAITQRKHGTLLRPDTTTLGQLFDEYLRVEVPKTVAEPNRELYRIVVDRHLRPPLGHLRARDLTVQHVEQLLAELQEAGKSSSLTTKVRMRLVSTLRMGERWGIVDRNVAEIVKPPRIEYREAPIWEPSEVRDFLSIAREHALWPLWAVYLETGARTSELLGIAWQDVNLDRGTLRLGRQVVRLVRGHPTLKAGGKSKAAGRTIRLTPALTDELKVYRRAWLERRMAGGPEWNAAGLVFTSKAGTALEANNVRRAFDLLIKAAGVTRIPPHSLRKTNITLALANGASPKAVAQRVGHADARLTLDTYSRVTASMDDQLLEIMASAVPVGGDAERAG